MSTNDTAADLQVLEAFGWVNAGATAWGLNLSITPLLVLDFWGTWNVGANCLFSLAALGFATLFGLGGWTPWRQPIYQVLNANSGSMDANPTARRTLAFLKQPRIRWTGAAIASSAALTPWIITALSGLAGGSPFGSHPDGLHRFHPMAVIMAALADVARAASISTVWMERQCRDNWETLREEGVGRGR